MGPYGSFDDVCYKPKSSGSGKVFHLNLGKTVEGCFRIPAEEKLAMTHGVILLSSFDFGGPAGHQMPGR